MPSEPVITGYASKWPETRPPHFLLVNDFLLNENTLKTAVSNHLTLCGECRDWALAEVEKLGPGSYVPLSRWYIDVE